MINKVTLIGNLGADPESRRLDTGAMVTRFSLATNENYKDKDGNWQKLTEWHNIVLWRDLAERAENMLKKGMQVYVEGKISYRKYTDKDGNERYVTDIVANTFRLLERLNTGPDSRFPQEDERAPSGNNNSTPTNEPQPESVASDGGDDLPF
jgi:single-strand DNA-binding protein